MKIFVVEDDKLYQEVVRLALLRQGYENVQLFSSAEECLPSLSNKPDVMLLDIGLARLNGVDLLKRVKQESRNIRAFMLSSSDDPDVIEGCKFVGADGYVVKGDDAFEQIGKIMGDIENRKKKKRFSMLLAATFALVSLLLLGLLSLYL